MTIWDQGVSESIRPYLYVGEWVGMEACLALGAGWGDSRIQRRPAGEKKIPASVHPTVLCGDGPNFVVRCPKAELISTNVFA